MLKEVELFEFKHVWVAFKVNTAEKQSGVGSGNIESAAYHDEHELTVIFWGLGTT